MAQMFLDHCFSLIFIKNEKIFDQIQEKTSLPKITHSSSEESAITTKLSHGIINCYQKNIKIFKFK